MPCVLTAVRRFYRTLAQPRRAASAVAAACIGFLPLFPSAALVNAADALADDAAFLEHRAFDSSEYWLENARAGKQCEGGQVAELLDQMANALDRAAVAKGERAVEILKRKRVVWNDYWEKNAVPGGRCNGEYVANLVHAGAEALREAELIAKYGAKPGLPSPEASSAFALCGAAGTPGAFNYVIGTQTFGAAYQFTGQPRLVETAEAIRALGSTVIKFELAPRGLRKQNAGAGSDTAIQSLADLARDEPSHRRVLDMPFSCIVLWAHTFHSERAGWRKGYPQAEQDAEYREIYDLAAHLLRTYSGTDKTFLLGHWEGDGMLRGSVARENDAKATPVAVQGMADWLNARQRAVDDAKRDTPHERVQIWNYAEVNHVKLAMLGRPAVVNEVLPKTRVDLVSYSSYDTASDPELLKAALNYIESKLPPRPELTGRRVFIGEYGFPAVYNSAQEQDAKSRAVIRAGIEWGCPLILYWELYNNEVDLDGRQRGFWMIDDKGVKQPVYEMHRRFYEWGRGFVSAAIQRSGRAPGDEAFRRAALQFLERPPAE